MNTKVEFIADGRSLSEYDTLVVVGEKHVTDSRVLPRFDVVNSLLKEAAEVSVKCTCKYAPYLNLMCVLRELV